MAFIIFFKVFCPIYRNNKLLYLLYLAFKKFYFFIFCIISFSRVLLIIKNLMGNNNTNLIYCTKLLHSYLRTSKSPYTKHSNSTIHAHYHFKLKIYRCLKLMNLFNFIKHDYILNNMAKHLSKTGEAEKSWTYIICLLPVQSSFLYLIMQLIDLHKGKSPALPPVHSFIYFIFYIFVTQGKKLLVSIYKNGLQR